MLASAIAPVLFVLALLQALNVAPIIPVAWIVFWSAGCAGMILMFRAAIGTATLPVRSGGVTCPRSPSSQGMSTSPITP